MTSTSTETLAPADSPAQIAERIFRGSPYHAIRSLTCDYCEGVLTIRGQLPSYHLKQTAQSVVKGLDGVEQIRNLAEVALA